jgi:hypothetical protein
MTTPKEEAIESARKDNGDLVLRAVKPENRGCYSCAHQSAVELPERPRGPGEEEMTYVGCLAQVQGYAALRVNCPNWQQEV